LRLRKRGPASIAWRRSPGFDASQLGREGGVVSAAVAPIPSSSLGERSQSGKDGAPLAAKPAKRSKPGYAAELAMPIGEIRCAAAMPIHAAVPAMLQCPHSIHGSLRERRAERQMVCGSAATVAPAGNKPIPQD
jgi:hypothetical protein